MPLKKGVEEHWGPEYHRSNTQEDGMHPYERRQALIVAMSLAFSFVSACVHTNSKGKRRAGPGGTSPLVSVHRDPMVRIYSKSMLASLRAAKPRKPEEAMKVVVTGSDGHRYTLVLDMSAVHYSLSLPEDRESAAKAGHKEVPLLASWKELPQKKDFLPAVALALKAKQFDDGLVAAVELAADKGLGTLPAKPKLLSDMLAAFSAAKSQEAAAIVAAALRTGGEKPQVPAGLAGLVKKVLDRRTIVQKTPIGFYTWNQALAHVYLRDKVLQLPFTGGKAALESAAKALASDGNMLAAYRKYLHLAERLTNKLQFNDLRAAAAAIRAGKTVETNGQVALFPPSKSPETDIALSLFGNKPIPDGFRLSKELIQRIAAGTLDLKPKPDSGWYRWQLHALAAIIELERLPEGAKLSLDQRYRKELEGLFEALYGLTRETHIKQLYTPMAGAHAPFPEPKVKLWVPMVLDTEPLVTYYERRAASYRFVRQVLEETFGKQALSRMHRETASGPINMDLDSELTLLESLFTGAAHRARRQLGMDKQAGETRQEAMLVAWWKKIDSDPDLGKDIRMMVPVFVDRQRGKVRAWAVLGLASRPMVVSYRNQPKVTSVLDDKGQPVPLDKFDLKYRGAEYQLPYLVSAEVWTSRILDRPTFRSLCDRHHSFKEIVAHIQ